MKKYTSIIIALAACVTLTGCSSIEKAIREKLPEYGQGSDPAPASPDAIDHATLQYTLGGFRAPNATLDQPRISNLHVTKSGLSFTYDIDLSVWGIPHTEAGQALACLFVKIDGRWIGGKFDWISSSRNTRDFNNIHGNYNGWHSAYLADAEAFAFVIVHKDAKRRSNTILREGKL